MSKLTPEMRQWLTDNREDYEFYMLHAMFHDPLLRTSLLGAPVLQTDFRREAYALVVEAITRAAKIMRVIGKSLDCPPTPEFMRTYVESAARELSSDDEVISGAMALVKELQDPKFKDQHYCVNPYFEAWYGSVRAKQAARDLQMVDIPDVHGALNKVQVALAAARQASVAGEDDAMKQFMDGDDFEIKLRRPTGIRGLDDCLNGGWGDHECYLLFAGTKGGKSIAAGQCAWHEAKFNNGYPLIVSTELWPREYGSRIVSNAAGIPINKIQDCGNMKQIRHAVASDPTQMIKTKKVDEVLQTIRDRIRIAKVGSEEGLDARAVMEREILRYENELKRRPTWICLDWLGSMADVGGNGIRSSADRALAWEYAANGVVKLAEDTGIPILVLAQAVNDAQLKRVLTLQDIGISKGIAKNMICAIGITNTIDMAGIKKAVAGKGDMPDRMFLDDQFFCIVAARKGEGTIIPVTRKFLFQRFEQKKAA
jgi:hypothetical protein